MGLGNSLIRKESITKLEISSLLAFSVFFSLLITLSIILSAPVIQEFYEVKGLDIMIYSVSPIFLLSAISGIYESLIVRELRFKALFFIKIVVVMISGVVAIAMAINGFSYFSLIVQIILQYFIGAVLLLIFSNASPSLKFSWGAAKGHLNFGIQVIGNSVLNYSARNFDNLLIGKYLGESSLGIYSKAYSLMMMPITNVSGAIRRVLFPTLSKLKKDRAQLSHYYIKSTTGIAIFSFPLMTGAFFTSEYLVLLFLGQQWLAAVPVFNILCFTGMMQSILTTTGSLFLAADRPDLPLKLSIFTKPLLFLLIFYAAKIGIKEVAIVFTLWSVLTGIIQMKLAVGLITVTMKVFLRPLIVILMCSVVMGVLVFFIDRLLTTFNLFYVFHLLILVVSGGIFYLVLVFKVKDAFIEEIKATVLSQYKK